MSSRVWPAAGCGRDRVIACWYVGPPSYRWHKIALSETMRNNLSGTFAMRQRGARMRRREFISLFGGLAAAWSLAAHAHAQESATMRATEAATATLPQIEVVRVKPVDRMPPNLQLSDNLIDLMKDFSLSSAQGIGWAWGIPPRPSTPFDERYGQW
jgi:hypothetical protein